MYDMFPLHLKVIIMIIAILIIDVVVWLLFVKGKEKGSSQLIVPTSLILQFFVLINYIFKQIK